LKRNPQAESPFSFELSGGLTLRLNHQDGTVEFYALPIQMNPRLSISEVLKIFRKHGHLIEVDYPDGLMWFDEKFSM